MNTSDEFQPIRKYNPIFPYEFVDFADEIIKQHLADEKTYIDFDSLDREVREDLAIYLLADKDFKKQARTVISEIAENCCEDIIYDVIVKHYEYARETALNAYIDGCKGIINDYFRHRMDIMAQEETRKEREEAPDFWDNI